MAHVLGCDSFGRADGMFHARTRPPPQREGDVEISNKPTAMSRRMCVFGSIVPFTVWKPIDSPSMGPARNSAGILRLRAIDVITRPCA